MFVLSFVGARSDLTSLFPLPRVLLKLSPGPLPSRTSPLYPHNPNPSPGSSRCRDQNYVRDRVSGNQRLHNSGSDGLRCD
uniref:Uncharacterized protein n=1 Tax=Knipowitschia caucasica TaxID=637954 RepID=A0AAV2M356_KNICA